MSSFGPHLVTTVMTSQYLLVAALGMINTIPVYSQAWLEEGHIGLYPAELLTTNES